MRRWLAPALAVVGMATSATPAAALLLWTLTATPLTVTSGVATSFSLTATNLDLLTELGCLEVDLPASFTIVGASAGNASNGDAWEAVVFPSKVAVHSLSGGGRLELGHSITFTITAIPTQAGTWLWPNHAHRQEDCSGTEELGTALSILVLPAATLIPQPTPTPTPTPIPNATTTPAPILSVGPLPTLPPILSTLRPSPSIGVATPAPTIGSVSSPTPSPTARPSVASVAGAASSPGDTSGSAFGVTPGAVDAGPAGLAIGEPAGSGGGVGEVSLGALGAIDGISVWAIPGAVVGGPGLLVILWVILQTGAALAWIPAVRRMRGGDVGRPRTLIDGPARTVAP